jgi:hypothetical protein
VFTLRDAAEVLRPEDAAHNLAGAVDGLLPKPGETYMKRLMAKNLELTARGKARVNLD